MKGLTSANSVTHFTGAHFLNIRVSQILNITEEGRNQLILGGDINAGIAGGTPETIDLNDVDNSIVSGDVGVRLMKRLLVQGHVGMGYFQGAKKWRRRSHRI